MLLKFLCYIDKSIRKQIKFRECVYHSDQEKYHFLNMCSLCGYAQFSQPQSYINEADSCCDWFNKTLILMLACKIGNFRTFSNG